MKLSTLAGVVASGAQLPTPIFRADLLSSIVPEIGTAGSFARATAGSYFDSAGGLASKTSGNARVGAYPDPAVVADAFKAAGLLIENKISNLCLESETPATAPWADVGTPTARSNTGTTAFNGTMNLGRLTTDAAAEGLTQDTGTSINGLETYVIFSFYAKAVSSTVAATMQIAGSGGTPQTATKAISITSTLERFFIYKQFSSAVSGTLNPQLTLDAAGDIYIGGFQVEYVYSAGAGGYENRSATPGQYTPTTTVAVVTNKDVLTYSGSELTGLGNLWTLAFWLWTPQTDGFAGDVNTHPLLLHADDSTKYPGVNMGSNYLQFLVDNSGNKYIRFDVASGGMPTRTKFDHYIVTADYVTPAFVLYRNGLAKTPSSSDISSLGAHAISALGFGSSSGDMAHGIENRVKVYDSLFSAGQALSLYNSEKSHYGL